MVIERGTLQLGLITMNSIWSENSGLRWSGTFLPMTERVWKVILPWSTIRAVKSVQVHPDVARAAVDVHPALALHRDDDGLQALLGRDVDLVDRAGAGDAVGGQAVQVLELLHGRLQSARS